MPQTNLTREDVLYQQKDFAQHLKDIARSIRLYPTAKERWSVILGQFNFTIVNAIEDARSMSMSETATILSSIFDRVYGDGNKRIKTGEATLPNVFRECFNLADSLELAAGKIIEQADNELRAKPLGMNERFLMVGLLKAGAIDDIHKVSLADITPDYEEPANYKRANLSLKSKGYVVTIAGRAGGVYLTPLGAEITGRLDTRTNM